MICDCHYCEKCEEIVYTGDTECQYCHTKIENLPEFDCNDTCVMLAEEEGDA